MFQQVIYPFNYLFHASWHMHILYPFFNCPHTYEWAKKKKKIIPCFIYMYENLSLFFFPYYNLLLVSINSLWGLLVKFFLSFLISIVCEDCESLLKNSVRGYDPKCFWCLWGLWLLVIFPVQLQCERICQKLMICGDFYTLIFY